MATEKRSPARLGRVMHVDDEDDIREITKLALESIGKFTVCSCSSGADALQKIPEFRPDLMLLDVMMPKMSGPDVLRMLRKLPEGKSLPVVLLTAKAQPLHMQAYRALGAIATIEKPFDPVTLSYQLATIWVRHVGS